MRSVPLFLVLVACCGGKVAEPVVVAPAPSAVPTSPTKPVVTTPPAATSSSAGLGCPSEAVRQSVLACSSASGSIPSYADVLDAESRVHAAQRVARPPKPKDFSAQPLGPEQQKLVELAKSFRCHGKGDASQESEVTYELARTYFESQHWEEAAAAFHVLAMARSPASEYAAQLGLESMNLLASRLHRPDCREALGPRVSLYRRHLCGSPPIAGSETCTTLTQLEAEIAKGATP